MDYCGQDAKHARTERLTVRMHGLRLRFTNQLCLTAPYSQEMTNVNARVSLLRLLNCALLEIRLHLGTQGQMPPTFLVLHALLSRP